MFVTSKSTLFTTFLISILVFLNKPSSANRKFVFCSVETKFHIKASK